MGCGVEVHGLSQSQEVGQSSLEGPWESVSQQMSQEMMSECRQSFYADPTIS